MPVFYNHPCHSVESTVAYNIALTLFALETKPTLSGRPHWAASLWHTVHLRPEEGKFHSISPKEGLTDTVWNALVHRGLLFNNTYSIMVLWTIKLYLTSRQIFWLLYTLCFLVPWSVCLPTNQMCQHRVIWLPQSSVNHVKPWTRCTAVDFI